MRQTNTETKRNQSGKKGIILLTLRKLARIAF